MRRVRTAALESAQTSFVELKVPETRTVTLVPACNPSFLPQPTLERNGFIIGVNTDTPRELLVMALEAAAHVE
ncbi:hypothetical protein [Anaerocolumna jejuensis]|uniref:hypothetical protein n=1 Tax=Anaerocolumna jejuensis TaxID=259063 RepID=UPI003F7CB58F